MICTEGYTEADWNTDMEVCRAIVRGGFYDEQGLHQAIKTWMEPGDAAGFQVAAALIRGYAITHPRQPTQSELFKEAMRVALENVRRVARRFDERLQQIAQAYSQTVHAAQSVSGGIAQWHPTEGEHHV